jgi:hypothetical protein
VVPANAGRLAEILGTDGVAVGFITVAVGAGFMAVVEGLGVDVTFGTLEEATEEVVLVPLLLETPVFKLAEPYPKPFALKFLL